MLIIKKGISKTIRKHTQAAVPDIINISFISILTLNIHQTAYNYDGFFCPSQAFIAKQTKNMQRKTLVTLVSLIETWKIYNAHTNNAHTKKT